jgi:toxin ParE1/3/4
MAEYRITPAAERALEAVWIYTLQRWGVEQTNRYIDILTATFADPAQSPKTAPACEYTT